MSTTRSGPRHRWVPILLGTLVAIASLAAIWWAEGFDVVCPAVYPGDPSCTEEYRRTTAVVSSAVVLGFWGVVVATSWWVRRARFALVGLALVALLLAGLLGYTVTLSSTGFAHPA
ncbi:hypothetical protein J4G33_16485 [Actinotalea sp. BY-33]|uniref:Vitamin K epoxide reductase family protein n=1 Tax=Actinotalea soli TaxID=2819234 RepID=A0A939LY57_9CELL|nr:hypothetical protein [Actinotalea soli]MBO1753407.1 hypothetical protein [Actinotalea soli]